MVSGFIMVCSTVSLPLVFSTHFLITEKQRKNPNFANTQIKD